MCVAVMGGVAAGGGHEEAAWGEVFYLLVQDVGLGGTAQVGHQGEQVWMGDGDGFAIRYGQGEAGALEQAAGIADIDKGSDARGDAAVALGLGGGEDAAEFVQGCAAWQHGHKQAVRFQDALDLGEGAGEVVDPVQAEDADDDIDAVFSEGKDFFVGDEGGVGLGQHIAGDVTLGAVALLQHGAQDIAVGAELDNGREWAGDEVEGFHQTFGGFTVQEVVLCEVRQGACAALA